MLRNNIFNQITEASKVALEKDWMTSDEIQDAIKPEKEDIRYDPYENKEDREPNY